jgi:STE24 endopeptidase
VGNATALISGAAVAAGTTLALFAVAARWTGEVERSAGEDRVHRLGAALRQLTRISACCGVLAAYLCVVQTRWTGIGAGRAALTLVVAAACLVAPGVAARRPVQAGYARLRGVPARALRSRRRTIGGLIYAVAFAWPVAVALVSGRGLAGRAAIVLAGYLVITPVLLGLLPAVLAPILAPASLPADVGARLSGLAARAGLRVRGRVIRARERKLANAGQLGWLPGLRYVLITDYLLDQLTPAETDAVIAHELGHVRQRDIAAQNLISCVAAIPAAVLIASLPVHPAPFPYLAGLALATFALIVVFGRRRGQLAIRRELGADDLAVALVGAGALADALDRLTELNAIKRDTSLDWDRQVGHPGMAGRIARLRAAAGARPPGDQAPAGPGGPEK